MVLHSGTDDKSAVVGRRMVGVVTSGYLLYFITVTHKYKANASSTVPNNTTLLSDEPQTGVEQVLHRFGTHR